MAVRGARPSVLDPEMAFTFWYHDGQRRTYGQVAAHFSCAYNTVRNCADAHDWDGRADELDARAREIVDARLANMRAQATLRLAEIGMAVIVKFAQRLPDKVTRDGQVVDNPDALHPGEVTVTDLLRAAKVLEVTGVIGAGGDAGHAELAEGLDVLRQQVAEMYAQESEVLDAEDAEVVDVTPALPAGDTSEGHTADGGIPADGGATVPSDGAGQGAATEGVVDGVSDDGSAS